MARYFLTRLAVEGLRGVNNENDPLDISFRPDAMNSVFAVNGIRTSSFFEALCYAMQCTEPSRSSSSSSHRNRRRTTTATASIRGPPRPFSCNSSPKTAPTPLPSGLIAVRTATEWSLARADMPVPKGSLIGSRRRTRFSISGRWPASSRNRHWSEAARFCPYWALWNAPTAAKHRRQLRIRAPSAPTLPERHYP